MKLGVPGSKKVPRKRFEALPVLAVSLKRVEACGSVDECLFSHWLAIRATDLGKMDNACAYNNH